jgi:hypothetical protein
MRFGWRVASLAALALVCATAALAQSPAQEVPAPQSVESLRAQLLDVKGQEAVLQAREKQLDEDLRPENIERSLALTGSTRPEELRAERRRLLEAEKARIRARLDLLATSRTRLEAAITNAEAAAAYRLSLPNAESPLPPTSVPPTINAGSARTKRAAQKQRRSRHVRQRSRRQRRRRP